MKPHLDVEGAQAVAENGLADVQPVEIKSRQDGREAATQSKMGCPKHQGRGLLRQLSRADLQ